MSRFDLPQPRSCRNREGDRAVSTVETIETLDAALVLQPNGAVRGVLWGLFIEFTVSAFIFCAIEIYRALHP
jgi:hypothetical protein